MRLGAPPPDLLSVTNAVADGEQAARRLDYQALGTANIHFHQALAALAGSPRVDELMRGLLAELRLVFHVMDDPHRFHEPFLKRNRKILAALEAGDGPAAELLLAQYLDDAQRQLVEAYAEHTSGMPTGPVATR